MNLDIEGRTPIVCGGSKGLGRACAISLLRESVDAVLVVRGQERLERAARLPLAGALAAMSRPCV